MKENPIYDYLGGFHRRLWSMSRLPWLLSLAAISLAVFVAAWEQDFTLGLLLSLIALPAMALIVPFVLGYAMQRRLLRLPEFEEIYVAVASPGDFGKGANHLLLRWDGLALAAIGAVAAWLVLKTWMHEIEWTVEHVVLAYGIVLLGTVNYLTGFHLRALLAFLSFRSPYSHPVFSLGHASISVGFFWLRLWIYLIAGLKPLSPYLVLTVAAVGEAILANYRYSRILELQRGIPKALRAHLDDPEREEVRYVRERELLEKLQGGRGRF